MKNKKGISLIVLIITIIVIIILASIVILTFTKNNPIANALQAMKAHKRAIATEEVNAALGKIKLEKIEAGSDMTLNSLVETSNEKPGLNLNLLECKLYDADKNVDANKIELENGKPAVDLFYRDNEFIIADDFTVQVIDNTTRVTVTGSVKDSTITSLIITSEISNIDMSSVTAIYYSCDNGVNWKDGNNKTEYTYEGLIADTSYNIKIKAVINGTKEVISDTIVGRTKSTADIIAKIPADFFTTADDGATISGINSAYVVNNNIVYDGFEGTLVIPTTWKGVAVTKIGESAISSKYNIQKLYIQEGVKTIQNRAFSGCTALIEVTLPRSLESVADDRFEYYSYAYPSFEDCINITKITIPQLVINGTYWVSGIFPSSYAKITDVEYNGEITTIGKNAFKGFSSLPDINIPNTVTSLGESAYEDCIGLTKITIPGYVKTTGRFTFRGCSNLTDLTIKSGVETISDYSFGYCKKLSNLVLEEGLKTIQYGAGAFGYCTALTEVTLPQSLQSISASPYTPSFEKCSNITKITIPQSMINGTYNMMTLFPDSYSKITDVEYNGEITTIGTRAFSGCSSLSDINIPNTVTSIGGAAYSRCTGLTKVTIPENIKTIGSNAFFGCSNITDLAIKSGVETIGDNSFSECTKLTNLVLEEGLKKILYGAFSGCTALAEVTLPRSLEIIDATASPSFKNCTNITKITLKKAQDSISGKPWGATNATVIWEP